jgi:hypothetical protein
LADPDPSFDQKKPPTSGGFHFIYAARSIRQSSAAAVATRREAATRDQSWQASASNGTRNRNTLDDNSDARIIKRFPIAEKVLQEGWRAAGCIFEP